MKVFFHGPGHLATNSNKNSLVVVPGEPMKYNMEYEVLQMLTLRNEPCILDKNYDRDLCTHHQLHQRSTEELGCTTPFAPNKSHICLSQNDSRAAMALYLSYFGTGGIKERPCQSPCLIFTFRNSMAKPIKNMQEVAYLKVMFSEYIRKGTASYSYTTLSLIAEVGGYVGLFLGCAIIQVSQVFDDLVRRCFK